jgi:benzoate-CoA ligase family protein
MKRWKVIDLTNLHQDSAACYFLDRHVEEDRGHRNAIFYKDQAINYEELYNLAAKAGNLFLNSQVDYENRVAIILPDCPLQVAAFFGLIRIGAVPVPLSTKFSADDYLYVFADCRPVAAIIDREHIPALEYVQQYLESHQLPLLKHIFVVEESNLPPGYSAFEDLLTQQSNECKSRATSLDDMALIQYTSGSTGTPKGVVHLHRGLLEVSRNITRRLELNDSDVCLSAAKLSFGYGLGNSVLFPFSLAASVILHPDLSDPFAMFDLINRYKPTAFFGVPSLYSAMLSAPIPEEDSDLSSLRLCVSAGEHLSATLFRNWKKRFGHEIIDGIGSTECLHLFISGQRGRIKPGSTGTVIEDNEAMILDDEGQRVATGEVGHLHIKSRCNAARYWNKHDETMATMIGPWTRTGDLFFQDAEGYFYFVGRSDDVIKVGGLKVSPVEIEECLLANESVKECAVIGLTSEEGISCIHAYVRLNPGWEPDKRLKRKLKEHVRSSISPHKCPKEIEFVSELPKTITGKIARYKLRKTAGA